MNPEQVQLSDRKPLEHLAQRIKSDTFKVGNYAAGEWTMRTLYLNYNNLCVAGYNDR